jgi:PhoH-like ATPase
LPGGVDETQPVDAADLRQLRVPLLDGSEKGGRARTPRAARAGGIQVEPLHITFADDPLPQQFIIVDGRRDLRMRSRRNHHALRRRNEEILVLLGDPGQIDNPYVDSASDGLTIAAERYGRSSSRHIVMSKR